MMKNMKWYADESAKRAHEHMSLHLQEFVGRCFPGYELSHTGFNRNEHNGEVIIKLHINPIGAVTVDDGRTARLRLP